MSCLFVNLCDRGIHSYPAVHNLCAHMGVVMRLLYCAAAFKATLPGCFDIDLCLYTQKPALFELCFIVIIIVISTISILATIHV